MNRKMSRQSEDQQRLIERAAEWFNVLEDASAEERAEFIDWIGRSPKHLEEFLLTTAVAREIKRVDLESLAPVQDALAMASAGIVHLPQPATTAIAADTSNDQLKRGVRFTRPWRWGIGLAATILIGVVAVFLVAGRENNFATHAGEQRTLQLADGTVVHLNMRSRIDVRFSRGERNVRLLEGEALFDVAPDAQRPFRVQSGASLIQAVGTEFNVLRRPLGTTVSVIEGIVQVSASQSTPARLQAGEEARIAVDGKIEKRQSVDVGAVAQWRQHRLEFRTDALVDIAAEFNRYNPEPQIVVVGDAIKTRHYSGVFDANDPESLLEFLQQDPELLLQRRGQDIVIRQR